MRNFRRVMRGIDVAPLLRQVETYPELWNADELWMRNKAASALYAHDNMVLRYIMWPEPTRPAFGVMMAAQEIVFALMTQLRGVRLGNVVISRLFPGQQIPPHIDMMPPGIPQIYQRYQIPISAAPGVQFNCGDEHLEMQPGEIWWFDNQQVHSVVNNSDKPRLSMFCDIRPFAV